MRIVVNGQIVNEEVINEEYSRLAGAPNWARVMLLDCDKPFTVYTFGQAGGQPDRLAMAIQKTDSSVVLFEPVVSWDHDFPLIADEDKRPGSCRTEKTTA